MGKKYSPSGYQIIDLGIQDLSSPVTINKGENADVDVLLSLYENKKLANKPILLKVTDSTTTHSFCGFSVVDISNEEMYLLTATSRLTLSISEDVITVGVAEL